MVRHRRAERHAARRRRQAQRGGPRGPADAKIKERFAQLGDIPTPMAPAEFGRYIAAETEKWGKVVTFANVKAD